MVQNKRKLVFNLIILLIILIPVVMLGRWFLTQKKEVHIVIVDKTVLTTDALEHQGLYWILKHLKYVKPDGNYYRLAEDYYGFFPKEDNRYELHDLNQFSGNQLDSLAGVSDMTYYTDTYGMYQNEWYSDTLQSEHSGKIYGGLDINDVHFLKKMKEKGKLIVTEFNLLANPTSLPIRRQVEKMFGFQWTGWTLRYFESLDTTTNLELPRWMINNFMEQHANQWPYTKSGIVFVHEDETIFVLQNEDHLNFELPVIHVNEEMQNKYNLPETMNYPFWIDINTVDDSINTTLANYQINVNLAGDSLLRYYHIPPVFPAVFEHSGDYHFYYFAGDYCDNDIPPITMYFRGITWLKRWMLEKEEVNNRELFFWNFYYPMMKVILSDYNTELEKRPKN